MEAAPGLADLGCVLAAVDSRANWGFDSESSTIAGPLVRDDIALANRATQLLGEPIEAHVVHPNDHVNFAQSSNDVIPTAIHIAAIPSITERLLPALDDLARALSDKSAEFASVVKSGRTHLMDATPGSSIMPGKVNPVMCEMLMQVCAQVHDRRRPRLITRIRLPAGM